MSLMWSSELYQMSHSIGHSGNVDWSYIRSLFPITQWEKIQFNSGSAGVMPTPVFDYLTGLMTKMNAMAPYVAWGEWQDIKAENLKRIARLIHVRPSQIAIVRNTTEALNMIIYGIRFSPGDEIVAANHDYPHALSALTNRAKRDRLKVNMVDMTLPASDDEVLEKYARAITKKTRLVLATYMTHREGHILPVRQLAQLAHDHDAELIVDAAHAIGQFEHNLSDLGADFYATSLHKWLNTPHGTGLIYARDEHLSALYPYPSSANDVQDDIVQFEYLGTRPFAHEIGVSASLDFHDMLDPQVKQKRLHELKLYWAEKVQQMPKVHLRTDLDPGKSCAVATFYIDGKGAGEILNLLDKDFDIHAKSVGGSPHSGIRISTNVFTGYDELDKLVTAIDTISKSG